MDSPWQPPALEPVSGPEATASEPAPTATETQPQPAASSKRLGFHGIGSTSHIARLSASQAAELMQRRSHMGTAKLRAMAHTTSDVPKVVASAPSLPARTADVLARITKTSHSGTLSAPAPEPGVLHCDLKEMIVAINGFRYIVFLIDEHSRYVFYDFVKVKSEVAESIARGIACSLQRHGRHSGRLRGARHASTGLQDSPL